MFSKTTERPPYLDLSNDISDPEDWKIGLLRSFEFPSNISCLAVDPLSSFLAIGTASGILYIFGGPGVEIKITLPEPTGAKFVYFSHSTHSLVCLDANNSLHTWDLLHNNSAQHVMTSRFDKTNSMTLSPSHSHIFLALDSGEIKTYDLACLRKSSYFVPNLWTKHEKELALNGIPSLHSSSYAHNCVEVVIHPRDLNLIFIAYAGGVVLYNLSDTITIHTYELVYPPGAPGGGGYESENILTHRRPEVTTLAVHPNGHFFAVGYADGAIAFWAVEDEKKPLLVRTLSKTDINLVAQDQLDAHLKRESTTVTRNVVEPIFKLSWSAFSNSPDPRGGETTLTILGGLHADKIGGPSVLLLPAFNPDAPTDVPTQGLHPVIRKSMRQSLDALNTYFYNCDGIVQDYLLIPKSTPHFSGAFDPHAILILYEGASNKRVVTLQEYPPPCFSISSSTNTIAPEEPSSTETELDVLLQDLESSNEPNTIWLPFILSAGDTGPNSSHLISVNDEIYRAFVGQRPEIDRIFKGGSAWFDEAQLKILKLSKYQPRRILITQHNDFTIRFHDFSSQLLIPPQSQPLDHNFPESVPSMTIDLASVWGFSGISELLGDHAAELSIQSIHLAPESIECAVAMKTGEVVVYHLCTAAKAPVNDMDMTREGISVLNDCPIDATSRLVPHFIFAPKRGIVQTCAISEIGFLAVAYKDESLVIVNMRGPNVILQPARKKTRRHSFALKFRDTDADPFSSLTWTVSNLAQDTNLGVRLVAIRSSGHSEVYTVARSGVGWAVTGDPIPCKAVASPLPYGSFVLDSRSGVQLRADRGRLSTLLNQQTSDNVHSIFIAAGTGGVRSYLDINGERLGRAEWPHKSGRVEGIQVVGKLGSHSLVAWTDKHIVMIYSLPRLEHIHSSPLFSLPPSVSLTMDESGDFIAWCPENESGYVRSAHYGTLFDIRRSFDPPTIDLTTLKHVVPSQPQPVSVAPPSMLNWFTYNQTPAGSQIDELLGGQNRPILLPRSSTTNASNLSASTSAKGIQSTAAGAAAIIAATASAAHTNLYDRLTSAVGERGQLLGDLEDRFNSLEEGSKNMVTQAKRLATQQTAKSWFGL